MHERGPVDDHGGDDAFKTQPGDKCRRLPVAMRDGGAAAFTAQAATAQAGHLCGGPGFVQKHKLGGVEVGLCVKPRFAPGAYVRAFLLAGMRGLFLNVMS